MVTNEERREVAKRFRKLDYEDLRESLICAYLDALGIEGYKDWVGIAHHLADLIEPSGGFDPDAVKRACFEGMEGCGEPEWTLYTTVYGAICRYERGESGPVAPPCDRDALLAIADEMVLECDGCRGRDRAPLLASDVCEYADRIREALGEVES